MNSLYANRRASKIIIRLLGTLRITLSIQTTLILWLSRSTCSNVAIVSCNNSRRILLCYLTILGYTKSLHWILKWFCQILYIEQNFYPSNIGRWITLYSAKMSCIYENSAAVIHLSMLLGYGTTYSETILIPAIRLASILNSEVKNNSLSSDLLLQFQCAFNQEKHPRIDGWTL